MEVFRASDVPEASRAAYWSEVCSRAHAAPIVVSPSRHGPFQAELQLGSLGEAELACLRSWPASTERRSRPAGERMIGFFILTRGAGVFSHCGFEIDLEAGDVVMTDTRQRMLARFHTPMEAIMVRAPETALRTRLPGFEAFRGRRLPGRIGLTDTSVAMAKQLATKLDGSLSATCAARASDHFLDMLATSYGAVFAIPTMDASLSAARHAQILAFIDGSLADPELRPATVASGLGISSRYLRKVLADNGETASALILRRRLEECARELASESCRFRSITDIAFSWGFNSAAHFARVFREKFGETPRGFRLRSQEERRLRVAERRSSAA